MREKRKQNWKKLLAIVLVIALLLLVAGIISLFQGKKERQETNQKTAEIIEEQLAREEEPETEEKLPGESQIETDALPKEWYEEISAETSVVDYTITPESTVPDNNVANRTTEEKNESDIDLELDTDNDGAEDYIEDYFKTDKNKTDTDGDGLNDFIELYSLVLDPLSTDTDGNGVLDGDEDLDSDGLTNITEIRIHTSILHSDSDEDGLSDADENIRYGTEPNKKDTDEDGVSDPKEIEMGTNPLVCEETFYTVAKAENEDTVKVSVEANLSGEQVETLSVKRFESEFLFPTSMPGYIGGAYDFSVDGEFSVATIKFAFDEALLTDENFEPVIYYFDEENQVLEEIETTVNGNVASANVTHFSKYILLNGKVYKGTFVWREVGNPSEYAGVEAIFVVEKSFGIDSNDPTDHRLTVGCDIVDALPDGSRFNVIRFSDIISGFSGLSDRKESAKGIIGSEHRYKAWYKDRMYESIQIGLGLFETTDDTVLKIMIVLADDSTCDTNLHSKVVEAAIEKNVKIYVVGYGSGEFTAIKRLAEKTGGAFYYPEDADQLIEKMEEIEITIDTTTDSDGDGIPDYYEENLLMFNGVSLKLDKNNPDTDGDGLLDGEEIKELNYCYNEERTRVRVTAKLESNPLEIDSDIDEISDAEEIIIGTNRFYVDTDDDGLLDGIEYAAGFDPLVSDADGDGRSDLREYQDGTDPYVYNKDWNEYVWDFICGFVAGDFITDTDSMPLVAGQILSSFIFGSDIRDIVGNLVHGDYLFAGLSAAGNIPVGGDALKAVGKVGKFVGKNIDEIPKVVDLCEFINKNLPEVAKVLGKSDDFVEVAKQISKADNLKLTRQQRKVLMEMFENAGVSHYLIKTSDIPDLKKAVDIGEEVWENGACKRGSLIDEFINGHISGNPLFSGTSLGSNFPVFDRWMKNEKILVSTKSLDVAAQSYQNPNKLRSMLNKYADEAIGFEKKYMQDGVISWGGITLQESDYDKKVLEIVLPDVIITDSTLSVLNDFKSELEKSGMEVWYRIAK